MVDIHCHILPNLDDGAPNMEIACEMAEMAIAEGVTHVVATPHANSHFRFVPELVSALRSELQAKFDGRLTLATGCDFHLSFDNLQEIRTKPERFTINQKSYLLVEFADFSIPPVLDQSLHELQLAGLHPIVTHPERNPLIRAKPERLRGWLQQGCYVQITAQSLLGKFGESAQQAAEEWLAAGMVHFVASDAHNVTSRPLKLKETFDLVANAHGEPAARALFIENPRAAFEGQDLPYIPEIPDQLRAQAASPVKRKRFWLF
jgi:protein-tyrosine phosphatase